MKTKCLSFLIILLIICTVSQSYSKPSPPNINGLYKFTGKLNNKIPVFLWFVVKDSVLKGEVTYLKTAKRIPITVIGTITKDDGLRFFEFGKGGSVSGIYTGLFNTCRLTGSWWAPGSERELKYDLAPKDTLLTHVDTDLRPVSLNGSYEYHFGKKGSDGGIDLRQDKPGEFSMEINCVTAAPQNNIAEVERTKVRMINNTIIYKSPDEDCGFRVRMFKGFVVIDNPLKKYCHYGVGADVDGVFIKVSDNPSFSF
jgi:hypothetical protein